MDWQNTTPPTSERVAIAEAVAERLKGRHGSNQFKAKGVGNISHSPEDQGRTTDLAASKVGLGSGKTLEAAQAVIAEGSRKSDTPTKIL